jgi:hypothetical protein
MIMIRKKRVQEAEDSVFGELGLDGKEKVGCVVNI